jgi:hypothetical protein
MIFSELRQGCTIYAHVVAILSGAMELSGTFPNARVHMILNPREIFQLSEDVGVFHAQDTPPSRTPKSQRCT